MNRARTAHENAPAPGGEASTGASDSYKSNVKQNGKSSNRVDLERFSEEVIARVDWRLEYEQLCGLVCTKPNANAKGWIDCFAKREGDRKPSGGINIHTGYYKDFAGEKCGPFEAMARFGGFADWMAARDFFADKYGVARPIAGGHTQRTKVAKMPPSAGDSMAQPKAQEEGNREWLLPPTETQRTLAPCYVTSFLRRRPEISRQAFLAASPELLLRKHWHAEQKVTRYCLVWAFTGYDSLEAIEANRPSGRSLYQANGEKWWNGKSAINAQGSTASLFPLTPASKLSSALRKHLVEGCSDGLALLPHVPTEEAVIAVAGVDAFPAEAEEMLAAEDLPIYFDRDPAGVLGAEKAAARFPNARTIRLPFPLAKESDDAKDLRDFFRNGGTFAELQNMPSLSEADYAEARAERQKKAVEKGNDDGDGKKKPAVINQLSMLICQENCFAQDAGGRLYRFVDGAYRAKADAFIKAKVKGLLLALEEPEKWTPSLAEAVVEYIRVDAPELWERPPEEVLNLKNGLLRIIDDRGHVIPFDQLKLAPHSAGHLSTVQLPVDFKPAAECPHTEKFVAETFPQDALDLAWEIPAYLMTPNTDIQKSVLALGSGGNGKSTWLAQLIAFLGRSNIAAKSLHKLEEDRFAVSAIYGKLANICPDLPTEHLAGTSVFKAITGGDPISGEYKFKDSFDFTPFCRLVFSANSPPRSHDASQGFFDRWLVIPFERSFRDTTKEIPRKVLDGRLASPAELSGLLNKALQALPGLRQRHGFTKAKSTTEAWREFQSMTDPLAVWLDRNTIDSPSAYVTKSTLIAAYNAAQERNGRPPIAKNAFGAALKRHRPKISEGQKKIGEQKLWCYIGIGIAPLSDNEGEGRHSSHGSHATSSNLLFPTNRTHKDSEDGKEGEGRESNKVRQEQVEQSSVTGVTDVSCDVLHLKPETWRREGEKNFCSVCNKPMGRSRPEVN